MLTITLFNNTVVRRVFFAAVTIATLTAAIYALAAPYHSSN